MRPLTLLTIALIAMMLGCSKPSKSEEQSKTIEEEANVEFIAPDNFFAEAITDFEEGAQDKTLQAIENAKVAIKDIVIKGDTVYSDIITKATNQLDSLETDLKNGVVVEVSAVRNTFSVVDREIARYNVDVVEDWARHGTNNEESLRRMHEAMVRIEYALNHSQIELSEYDSISVALAKRDLLKAEKVSSSLWEKVKASLSELNRKFDSGTNSLDNN